MATCGGCSGSCSGCNGSGSCSDWKSKVDNNTCSGCGTSCSRDCGSCGSSCGVGCDGCSGSCDTKCLSCGSCDSSPCSSGCNSTCKGGCKGCGSGCATSCSGGCSGGCKGSCTGSCTGGCTGGCKGGCSSCTGGCTSCNNACTSTEMVTIMNNLGASIRKGEYIRATDFLELKNAFTKGFQWRGLSYKDVNFPTPVTQGTKILSSQGKALYQAMLNYNGINQTAEANVGAIVEAKDFETMITVVKTLLRG